MIAPPLRPAAPGPRRRTASWVAATAALAAACGAPDAPAADPRPRLVASIFPLADLAARVGGDDVAIEALVPPRADPSTFEPSPRQMQSLSSASAFLLVGGGLDEWMVSVPGSVESVPVVRMNEGLELRAGGHGEGTGDPHTWLDPTIVRDRWLPRIVEAVAAARPDAAGAAAARGAALADSLTALDGWIRERLAPVRGRAFVATHSAWRYFADRYGVVELGAVYDSPGREPSSREVAALLARARAAGVRAVFTEPQLGETGARAVAAELAADVALLDPLGGPGLAGRDSYLGMMRFNAEQIARALEDRP